MKTRHVLLLLFLAVIGLSACKPMENMFKKIVPKEKKPLTFEDKVNFFLDQQAVKEEFGVLQRFLKVEDLVKNDSAKTISVTLNRFFSYIPFREENVAKLYETFHLATDSAYHEYDISLITMQEPIENLIPNFYRSSKSSLDKTRMPIQMRRPKPIVRRLNKPYRITNGLVNHPVALWHSHGWYYNSEEDRWMWQRARLFGTVEDIFPMSFTLPYVIPMLENAGANVFVTRERSLQTNEVIVDNNGNSGKSIYREIGKWQTAGKPGFAIGKGVYLDGENPFLAGTVRKTKSNKTESASIEYVPEIPESGEYSVNVSWQTTALSSENVVYKVYHLGGITEFAVNQRIGGGTWIYLGSFKFNKGVDATTQKVVVSNKSFESESDVTSDAVRFGGGMGLIERGGKTSGRPKFVEGARYWMQYAGFPDTLVYKLNDDDDYGDDYQGRGEWVNYLKGAPYGPNKQRDVKGLGIPIDVSLAFHTDAGIRNDDKTVGTLMIYSVEDADSSQHFPDGVSRLSNRDFADILQTEIVENIRAKYDSVWTRRNLYNRMYSEAFRLNMPSALLELYSHQNFLDAKFAHDPRFKFDVSRSIYKAILKFIAAQYEFDYVVQPLPVTHLNAQFDENGYIFLSWKPKSDSLEPTANPDGYVVYTRINDGDFDNGVFVKEPLYQLKNPKINTIYSFKVSAVNSGGESFASSIVSAGTPGKGKSPVLIINGFNRISPPSSVDEPNFKGFTHFDDFGVPDKYDVSFTGNQHNYDPSIPWINDDEPGHGASYGDYETIVIPGNTQDYIALHGASVLKAGYPFVGASSDAVMDNYIDITAYKYVNLILGEQKATSWPKVSYDSKRGREYQTYPTKLASKLKYFAQSGGNIFISGSYVGTDVYRNPMPIEELVNLTENTLKYKYKAQKAVKNGGLFPTKEGKTMALPDEFSFNMDLTGLPYQVENPDSIEPADEDGVILLRYKENGFSAATAFEGYYKSVVFGFPFEAIKSSDDRDKIMQAILNFFDRTIDATW